jgi:uncharacterized protein (TIGR03000 family)
MLRFNLTKWTLGLAIVAGMVALSASSAEAHWHHHSCGSCGSWGSCGSSGGSWGSWGCCGSSGGCWGSSGGCWGSSGGSWGSSGGSSGGSWGSSGGSWGGTYVVPAPVAPAPHAPAASPPAPPSPAGEPGKGVYYQPQGSADAGYLIVNLPTEAKVFVNGHATTSEGAQRQFVSRGLEPGQRYAYEVRAQIERDGKTLTETRSVQLTGGLQANLSFRFDDAPATQAAETAPPRTKLLLHVPAEAKVFLAGKETNSSGSEREFSTMKLSAGAQWQNYTIRVVSGTDAKEQTITLKAGDNRELDFDFGATAVAASTR